MKVALFPGHVGKDSGAVDGTGDDNLYTVESVLVSAMVARTTNFLKSLFIPYKIVHGSFKDRIERSKGCTLGISVHCDYFHKEPKGFHVAHYPESKDGRRFAYLLDGCLDEITHHHRCRAPHPETYTILAKTAFPCVLLECGFISNPEDEKLLYNEKYQNEIAFAIATALEFYK